MGLNVNVNVTASLIIIGVILIGTSIFLDKQYGENEYSAVFWLGVFAIILGSFFKFIKK